MRPDLLACGRGWLRCTHCGGTWIPGGEGLRRECTTCGRKRCPWAKYGPAHCDRWKPKPHSRDWVQRLLFEDEDGDGSGTEG